MIPLMKSCLEEQTHTYRTLTSSRGLERGTANRREPERSWSVPGILIVELKAWGRGGGGLPSPAGLGSRSTVPDPDQAQSPHQLSPGYGPPTGSGPTLFQVQEQLGHAGRCVLLPALGLG